MSSDESQNESQIGSPLSRTAYAEIVAFDIAYLSALPVTPERTQQIASLRMSADLYSPPFSSAYERFVSTDVGDVQSTSPASNGSSPAMTIVTDEDAR